MCLEKHEVFKRIKKLVQVASCGPCDSWRLASLEVLRKAMIEAPIGFDSRSKCFIDVLSSDLVCIRQLQIKRVRKKLGKNQSVTKGGQLEMIDWKINLAEIGLTGKFDSHLF